MIKKFIVIFIVFGISCNKKDCSKPINEITVKNNAYDFYGGKKELVITDKEQINLIDSLLGRPDSEFLGRVPVNLNRGFLEVQYSTRDCKNMPLFNLIFTWESGEVIRYDLDNDNDSEYLSNQTMVDYLRKKMELADTIINN